MSPDQSFLFPTSPREWLSEDHLVYFVLDILADLDLSEIYSRYELKEQGRAAYSPRMMTALLLYAYCVGVPSSRRIERRTYEDVAFRILTNDQHPDHTRISEFRRVHLEAISGLFVQVLKLCQKAGMVTLGHVALDGSKFKANASKRKATSYKRMLEEEQRLKELVDELLKKAEATDDEEDTLYGKGRRDAELPEDLKRAETRLERIRALRTELEQEAREQREAEEREKEARTEAKKGARIYAKRKAVVEPVFGQIKEARGLRGFLLRGIEKVRAEFSLIALTHNLLKLFRNIGVGGIPALAGAS